MAKNHLNLQEHSGKLLWHSSLASKYLEELSIENSDATCRQADSRYLLPRDNIFTFGLQNGITDPGIFFSCKICQGQSFIKPHELKQHMLNKHPKQESSSASVDQTVSQPQPTAKSKKNSHKNKKKVVPPPSVPPPPLFPKVDFPPPSTASATTTSSDDLLPPVLQPAETIEASASTSHAPSEKVEAPTTTSKLPPTLSTQVPVDQVPVPASSSSSKPKEKSTKPEKQNSKHKRSKRYRNSGDYDPDKHCGVVDSSKRPCMRAVTCANHTIVERRAVKGRSTNIDQLIAAHKAARLKAKHHQPLPVSIAPKQNTSVKEIKYGLHVIDFFINGNQDPLRNSNLTCDDPIMQEVFEDLASMTHCAVTTLPREDASIPKNTKSTGNCDSANKLQSSTVQAPHSPQPEQGSSTAKYLKTKTKLSQPSPALPVTKLAEVPSSVTPMAYGSHPKPMSVLTPPLRRIGGGFLLQQAPRLDRQRVDLQAVINQHKQLRFTSSNKAVSLLNSNHNKQSILKSNIKNNSKINSIKRTSVDKPNVNDVKHVKVIATDINGFILNADFTDNEIQSTNAIQDKVTLLK